MEKFTEFEKLSKKNQKQINNQKRNGWGNLNPVTKIIPNKKKYSRKEKHKGSEIDD